MGGSGGSNFFGGPPRNVAGAMRALEQKASTDEFESQVAGLLASTLADANNRDHDAVATHVQEISNALGKDIEGAVTLVFGGSVAKRTYVDGVSDVDALVLINDTELAGKSPKDVCEYFERRLRERFPGTEVVRDGFALDVRFKDITIQIVPAIRRGDDYLLPDRNCEQWTRTRPKRFTDALTAVNKARGGKVIPTIKLAKALMSALPDSRRISGYHTELLAAEIFSSYSGPQTPKAMLQHFFAVAPRLVREPTGDPTGQSLAVDDHLGPARSVERMMVADSLDRIGRRLRNADGAQDIDQWAALFG